MSLRVITPFLNTNIPGAYPNVTVQSQPVGLGSSGVIVLMGEADGGNSYQNVVLSKNSFTPDQFSKVQAQYISGQIVDAFQAMAAPSADPNITGSANLIYIAKTNQGTQATALIPDYFTFTVTAANATAGAVYTNNNQSFTVVNTISGGTTLLSVGTGNPTTSGTLTKASGTGDATITFSAFTSAPYGTLTDSNWGIPGNQYKYQILSVDAEVAPVYTGIAVPAFGAPLNGQTFTIRLEGGAATVITLSGNPADHNNISNLVIELNGLLPAGILASAAVSPVNALTLTITPDATAYEKGWGKSFELFDSTPGDLAALGLTAGLRVSSQEPEIEINIVRPDININQIIEANADIALQVGYQGTTATLTINATTLSTTVSGGSGANLSIPLSQYKTISDLALFIASQTGYSALCPPNAQQLAPSALDQTTAGIASSGAGLLPGRIKDAAHNFQLALGTSVLVFAPGTGGVAGLPAPTAAFAFLSGGTRGATLAADIINVLNQLGGIQCNFIVPLFSQDATADIAAGVTSSSSTYTIAAINAAIKSHCLEFSTPALKKNRSAILSFNGTYANAKSQAQSLGTFRVSLTMQQVMQVNSTGAIQTFQPWYASVLAAGMQAGGFYKSILNKSANLISFIDPSGFDSGNPGSVEDGLSSGILFLSKDNSRAGYWVSDQTTYGFDTNFVYNSIQAVYASDLIALDLAQSFFLQFVGQSLADVSASAGLSFLTQKMDGYFKLKLIGSSTDAPLGFKNPKISIKAPEMDVAVEIKLATAIYFIPISINISQIQQSA